MIRPILARLRDLNRRVYASLPWGFRVANVILKLAYSITETVGRVCYAEFLKANVEGMPPGAEPGTKPERLPPGYGQRFGERLYALLLQKSRNPDMVEEVLAELMVTASKGKFDIRPGTTLRGAEQYVIRAALNILINIIRSNKRNQTEEIDDTVDVSDPNAFQSLDKMLPRAELERLMQDLSRINPRAPSWLEAQLEGLRNVELAEEWGVSKSNITGWEQRYVPEIKKVVLRYLREAA